MLSTRRQKFVVIVIGFVTVYSIFNLVLFSDFGKVSDGVTDVSLISVAKPTKRVTADAHTNLHRARRELVEDHSQPNQESIPTPNSPRELFSGHTSVIQATSPPSEPRILFTYNLDKSWKTNTALQHYQDFHRTALKCIEEADFKALHAEECNNIKFLTYRASQDGGFGNKVRAMMSAFLMAILSGRVFLLDWTVPAHWSLALAKPPIDWDFQRLSQLSSDLAASPFMGIGQLQSADITQALASRKSYSVESNSPFYHSILSNPRYKGLVESVFGPSPGDMPNVWNIDKGPIFETSILQFLVHPSLHVLNVTRPVQEKLREHYVIALHVRTWDGCTNFKCLDVFVDCGIKSAKRARSNGKSPVIFIAADRQDLVDQLKSRFAENQIPIVLYEEIIKHYVDAAQDPKEQKDRVIEKMMADFYLIGEADLFLGTWYSSFSENGGLRTGLETFLFGKGPDKDIYPDWCKQEKINVQ